MGRRTGKFEQAERIKRGKEKIFSEYFFHTKSTEEPNAATFRMSRIVLPAFDKVLPVKNRKLF
jgi:hypothetical protein